MNGVINLLKPPGVSSSFAVVFAKKLLGVKKAGHAGTLDPGAAGVLAILLDRATKLSDYLMNIKKEYIAEIAFGASTDTGDSYGRVLAEKDVSINREDFIKALGFFKGEIEQATPAYSAAKQDGRPLYSLARAGMEIKEKQRIVTVHDIEYLDETAKNRFLFRAVCSKGTYIRALCGDIGKKLSAPSYMSMLIRTKASGLDIKDSYTFCELEKLAEADALKKAVIPAEDVLHCFDKAYAGEKNMERLVNGNTVYEEKLKDIRKGVYRIYCGGRFLGLGEAERGSVKINILLKEES